MTRHPIAMTLICGALWCPPAAGGGDVPVSRAVEEAVRRPPVLPSCGVDALYFVLRVHGRADGLAELAGDVRLTERGSSLADLRTAARARGLTYECLKCGPEDLRTLPLPAIAHVVPAARGGELAHFVVLLAVRANSVVVFDPNDNRFTELPLQDFNRHASGFYLAEHQPLFPGWLAAAWATAGTLLGVSGLVAARRRAAARPVPAARD